MQSLLHCSTPSTSHYGWNGFNSIQSRTPTKPTKSSYPHNHIPSHHITVQIIQSHCSSPHPHPKQGLVAPLTGFDTVAEAEEPDEVGRVWSTRVGISDFATIFAGDDSKRVRFRIVSFEREVQNVASADLLDGLADSSDGGAG